MLARRKLMARPLTKSTLRPAVGSRSLKRDLDCVFRHTWSLSCCAPTHLWRTTRCSTRSSTRLPNASTSSLCSAAPTSEPNAYGVACTRTTKSDIWVRTREQTRLEQQLQQWRACPVAPDRKTRQHTQTATHMHTQTRSRTAPMSHSCTRTRGRADLVAASALPLPPPSPSESLLPALPRSTIRLCA